MRRRILMGVVAVALVLPLVVAQPPTVARAELGVLDWTSHVVYTIDPPAHVVHVQVDFTVTHNDLDAHAQGYFYASVWFGVPADITNVNILRDGKGRGYTVEPQPDIPGYAKLNMPFGKPLYYRQSLTFRVTFDLPTGANRSSAFHRFNDAYFAFRAEGVGDSGTATTEIVVPAPFVLDSLGPEWSHRTDGNREVYTFANIPDPDNLGLVVTARNDAALSVTEVALPGDRTVMVEGWPDDPEWTQFVSEQAVAGVPTLEDLIGLPWPSGDPIRLREKVGVPTYSISAQIDPAGNLLHVGESLDPQVLLHELSHAWFRPEQLEERWLVEGLAHVYAKAAADELGVAAAGPKEVDLDDPAALPLNSWAAPDPNVYNPTADDFGSNAAFQVMQHLVDEVGFDSMREVITLLDTGGIAYVGDGPPELGDDRTDWRRFLDLLERVGGADTAADVFLQWVVEDDDLPLMHKRNDARGVYTDLESHGNEWAPPLGVRSAMSDWSFATATSLMEAAELVLTVRDQLDAAALTDDLAYPADFETRYEAATTAAELDELGTALQQQLDTARVVQQAIDAEGSARGVLGAIGLVGRDTSGELDEARAAFADADASRAEAKAHDVIDAVDGASTDGIVRLIVVVGVAALVTVVWRRRRRQVQS